MHKRLIRLAISAIMLALFIGVPVDAAGQDPFGIRERAELRQEKRERPDRRKAVPREYDRRDSAPVTPRGYARPRNYDRPRDYERRGSYRRGYRPRGFGQLSFGNRGGFRSRFNFNFRLGGRRGYYSPQYYPPYYGGCGYWDELDWTLVYRGGRYVREYFCVNMSR